MTKIWVRLRVTQFDIIAPANASSLIVTMKAQLAERVELRTPGGRSMIRSEWSIRLSNDVWTGSLGGIGVASHMPEFDHEEHGHDEFFSLELSTSPTTLTTVIEMARGEPSDFTVSFETTGLGFGWEPNGSAVEWDCDAHRHIPVTDASFKSNLMQPAKTLDVEYRQPAQPLPTVTPPALADTLSAAKIIALLRILALIAGAGLLVLLLK